MNLWRKQFKTLLPIILAAIIVAVLASAIPQTAKAVVVPQWTQTSQSDFASGTLDHTDIATSPGDVVLSKDGSDYVYAFRGNNTKTFYRYDVSAGMWSALADAPQTVGAGGALVYTENDYIYALGGNNCSYFWRYSISGNSWTNMASTSSTVNAGGALTWDTGNYIYAFKGGSRTFWQYSISGNSWTSKKSISYPYTVAGGGALAYAGGFVYAFLGGSTNYFMKYTPSSNTWSWLSGAPSSVSDGGSLAWDGNDYIYGLKGDNTVTFWRYSISSNAWTAMADTPATPCVYGGGALTYDGSSRLYALRGNNEIDFWRYNVAPNTWDTITGAPATVAYGGALAYRRASYYASGTLTSSAFDTTFISNFLNISWNAVTPSGTAVKFQVAANNDNTTWSFTGPDGTASTYYTSSGAALWTGLNGNRYIKYKAYLSTTGSYTTPVLNDVTISYEKQITIPVTLTSAAGAVEETGATVNGHVNNDGQDDCQYAFQYGTSSGVYTATTPWTGTVHTGDNFNSNLTGLSQGTLYYYQAMLQNTAGTSTGSEMSFLTKPEAPLSLGTNVTTTTEIDLSWTKGAGANRTKIMRKTGGYPTDYNDGTQVYYDTGTSVSDTGLTPNTIYYYRAWSEVTAGSYQQWSDNYVSASCVTVLGASVTSGAATSVEETTATLNGTLADDGGQACQYSFEWGTAPGVYTNNSSWAGPLYSGQTFTLNISGLSQGMLYYYRARAMNDSGIVNGAEREFLTKPDQPAMFIATAAGDMEIDLTWSVGAGADRVKIVRKLGSFPTDMNDGTEVYFGTGGSFPDTGLTPDTQYFYAAWSEVSADSLEQWSDGFKTVSVFTSLTPVVVTEQPTAIEETTATLHGSVTFDGNEPCQYRFEYGTAPGVYTMNTGWTGSVVSGEEFSFDVTGLSKGTKYYYLAELKNSSGVYYDQEQHFLTKPDPPFDPNPMVAEYNATSVTLHWTKGDGAQKTMIRRKLGGYPTDRFNGDLIYFDTGTSCVDTGLDPNTVYYYRAWSQVSGSEQWSDGYMDLTVETSLLSPPPTTTPPPTTSPTTTGIPVSVGGTVYSVNKMEILAPWLFTLSVILAVAGGFLFREKWGRKKH